ncbi:hypothetical protein ACFX15_001689 [Malus domestica]
MEGDGIGRLKKLFHALIAVLTLLQCVNSSPALGSNNISSRGVMRCIEREREALLAIKQKLVDDYNVFSSWGREEHKQDCCKWVGVHCSNRTNHVTQLNLGRERLDQAYSLQQKGDPQEIKYYLQGHIPKWLGVSLQNLSTLVLSSNNFNGSMPPELCRLTNIQNLDVSVNNISGTIPKCLSTLTVLAQKGNSSPTRQYQINDTLADMHQTLEFKNTLGFLTRIDFSSNRLTGAIPSEITDLVGLVSLNLSRNKLTGELPVEIGKLQSLVALDLSRNQINGRIPTSLAQIHGLDVLYLSYNNFIGEIPTTRLQSFDPSVYAGNPQLCGPPLQNTCCDEEEKNEPITWGFYVSVGLGFFVGFWGVFGSLIFVRPWRYSYFRFLNVLNDWFYVKVVLIKRHFS